MNMMLKKTNNERGVIMMETLIMLPVYLVILSGIFWLGEMCLIRQTLNNAERLRLWESGNRQSGFNQVNDSNIYAAFVENPSGTIDSTTANQQVIVTGVGLLIKGNQNGSNDFYSDSTSNNWGVIKQGFVCLNTQRSAWSYGIADFVRNNLWPFLGQETEQEKIAKGRDAMRMVSRGDATGKPLDSVMLFRMDVDTRATLNFSGNTCWHNVFAETWGPKDSEFIKPVITDSNTPTPTSVSAYGARNSKYVEWSE